MPHYAMPTSSCTRTMSNYAMVPTLVKKLPAFLANGFLSNNFFTTFPLFHFCVTAGLFNMISTGGDYVIHAGHPVVHLQCQFTMDSFDLFENPVIWSKQQGDVLTRVNMMGTILQPFLRTSRFSVYMNDVGPKYHFTLSIKCKYMGLVLELFICMNKICVGQN